MDFGVSVHRHRDVYVFLPPVSFCFVTTSSVASLAASTDSARFCSSPARPARRILGRRHRARETMYNASSCVFSASENGTGPRRWGSPSLAFAGVLLQKLNRIYDCIISNCAYKHMYKHLIQPIDKRSSVSCLMFYM
jgi:hypothetical protein